MIKFLCLCVFVSIIASRYFYNSGFYSSSIYPVLNSLDKNKIRREFFKITNKEWKNWPEYDLWGSKSLNIKPSWTVIPLMAFGKWSEKNVQKYRETYNELKKIPGLMTAGFSKLGPKTSLEYHKGWGELSNNVLRCHLGIDVPKNTCRIFVKPNRFITNSKVQENNKWIVFDDSLTHSADNMSENDRIVLILDIKRPISINKGTSRVKFSPELENFIKEFNN